MDFILKIPLRFALFYCLVLTSYGEAAVLSRRVAASQPVVSASPGISATAIRGSHETFEKDYPLRSTGEISVINARGDIVVEGWAQDRVRVRGEKTARIEDPSEAHRLMGFTDFGFSQIGKTIELSAEYGKGLDIEQRLKERSLSRVSMDLTIYAPSSLPLKVWAVNGKVTVRNWSAPIEVRTTEGAVEIENVKRSGEISVFAPIVT